MKPTCLDSESIEFERDCLAQARAEIGLTPSSGFDQIHKVLTRAQEIKHERLRKLGPLSVEEILERSRA